MLQALLGSAGLTPDDVTIVEYPDFSQGAAVDAGRRRRRDRLREQRAGPARADRREGRRSCASTTSRRCPGPGLIAGAATLETKHDAIAAFVAATLRAMEEIKADPEAGLDAAIAAVPELASARDTPGGHPRGDHRLVDRAGPGRPRPRARSTRTAGRLDRVPDDARARPEPGHRRRRPRRRTCCRPRRLTAVLGGVRPSGDAAVVVAARGAGRRGGARRPGTWPAAAPPLRGTTTADVVILGGGYTGLWTALRV